MLENHWFQFLLIIVLAWIGIRFWNHYQYLILMLKKASYLYYSAELRAAKKRIESATCMMELKSCQREIDELYKEAARFCKMGVLEEIFLDIDLLLLMKEMDIQKRNLDDTTLMRKDAF